MLKQHMYNLEEMLNDASIDRIMAIDTGWNIIAWNKTSECITGIPKQQLAGRNLFDIFPLLSKDKEVVDAFERGMAGQTSFLPSRPGLFNRDYYENHFIPLRRDNEVIGVMNLMHDVSHRIKAEQQLQQLNAALKENYNHLVKANSELSTFTSITGNELKDPIKKVYTALEMLIQSDGAHLSNSSKAKLRRAQASLNRMNLLLDDIISVSSINSFSPQFKPVSLQQIMEAVMISLERKIEDRKARINLQQLPVINGSLQMLHNLFYNLLDNALKFQPPGNQPFINITIDRVSKKEDGKEYIVVGISDNGIGFDQADAERIFLAFEKLHPRDTYPGSGIGLTICRKIMDAHGGFIEAKSQVGEGTSFYCYFPMEV